MSRWTGAALAALFVLPAAAQERCAPRDVVLRNLAEKYREAPVGAGVSESGGSAYIVLAAEDGKTWTILALLPDGRACAVAAGADWQVAAPVAKGDPS